MARAVAKVAAAKVAERVVARLCLSRMQAADVQRRLRTAVWYASDTMTVATRVRNRVASSCTYAGSALASILCFNARAMQEHRKRRALGLATSEGP